MLTREENQLLTNVGPGTPQGGVLRRYWLPALLSEELAEPDGTPVPVRLLGEDLVAFRDTRGRTGSRRWSSRATKGAGSPACIMGGSSTSTATASTCRPNRKASASRTACA